jgi:hypothetical protein
MTDPREIELKLELPPTSVSDLETLGRARPRRTGRKRAYAAGVLTGYEDARFQPVLDDASRAASALLKARSFW